MNVSYRNSEPRKRFSSVAVIAMLLNFSLLGSVGYLYLGQKKKALYAVFYYFVCFFATLLMGGVGSALIAGVWYVIFANLNAVHNNNFFVVAIMTVHMTLI